MNDCFWSNAVECFEQVLKDGSNYYILMKLFSLFFNQQSHKNILQCADTKINKKWFSSSAHWSKIDKSMIFMKVIDTLAGI